MTSFPPGRLVMVDIPGTRLDADTADFLARHHIGGVCLFRKNLGTEAEVRTLTAALREVMGPGALIGIDQEGGAVVRATFLPPPPAAMALGAADSPALAQAVGAAVARGLKGLGINWNFAPVLDINSNPANPVIAERAFGDDAATVERLAGAWMRGSLAEGVACCVKHFPGHGDTQTDSHHALPVVHKSRAELYALELAPFRALCPEAPAVMTAHIVYPQLDAERPATLSPAILQGILRDEWGYDGVVITDALMMQAVAARWGHARAAVMALQAGADLVLAQGSREEQQATLDALQAAFADGRLALASGARAAARLNRLAVRFPATPGVYDPVRRQADEGLMQQAWTSGLATLLGATAPALGQALRVVVQAAVPTDQVSEAGPEAAAVLAMFAGFADVQPLVVPDLAAFDGTALPADGRLNVLVSTRRDRHGPLPGGWQPDLLLLLWNPFQALDTPAPTLLAWGHAAGALAAVRAWLEGRVVATGRAPASLQPRAVENRKP
ncbi:beta-N-acetylhexosaminidase [Rubrivivax rivuli]|uniref:Beta-N-acetylhexosaminidase n=1 Tax=Rubrivivax rivuli TaxID=1862385 RepID=A0A437RC87_9BURK|nr:beta-N-acetylhexosaminidase [Rubrivivax rivuli]RVU44401.1 beta-N-acetylhexosaminidase [Rubrivivax rivuli]